MITRNLTLTITDKSVSLDKAIILYQYDRGVTFNFKLVSADYTFSSEEITKARSIIKRPDKSISTSEIDDILDGVYTFHLDGSYTNDAFEVGIYTMQLQLYSNLDECITIAPFTFEVKDLIGIPADDAARVGYSTVGYSSVRSSDVLDTGNLANGEYLETVWIDKDIITSGRLNKIETVLDYLVGDAANNGGGNVDLTGYATEQYVNDKVAAHAQDVKGAGYAMQSYVDENFATTKYVDKAIANIEVSGGGINIMTIGNGIDEYIFTGNEFTYEEYTSHAGKSVLLDNVTINFVDAEWGKQRTVTYKNELVYVSFNGDKLFTIASSLSDRQNEMSQYSIGKDGTITRTYYTQYVTKDYVNEQIGDINAILDAINGEII